MLNRRLKELRKMANITQADLSKALSIEQSSIAKYESPNKPVTPPPDRLLQIAKYFGVTVDYLLGNSESPTCPSTDKSGVCRIPVLGDVAAGIPIEAITDIVDYEEIDAALAKTGDFFGLRIKGSSMEPRMREGDVVIVRKQNTAESGETVVVLVNGDSATVKKIKYGPDGITLMPPNPSYDPIFYSASEVGSLPVRVIGKVIELRAKY